MCSTAIVLPSACGSPSDQPSWLPSTSASPSWHLRSMGGGKRSQSKMNNALAARRSRRKKTLYLQGMEQKLASLKASIAGVLGLLETAPGGPDSSPQQWQALQAPITQGIRRMATVLYDTAVDDLKARGKTHPQKRCAPSALLPPQGNGYQEVLDLASPQRVPAAVRLADPPFPSCSWGGSFNVPTSLTCEPFPPHGTVGGDLGSPFGCLPVPLAVGGPMATPMPFNPRAPSLYPAGFYSPPRALPRAHHVTLSPLRGTDPASTPLSWPPSASLVTQPPSDEGLRRHLLRELAQDEEAWDSS